jgi:cellulose biosynthesis protein BcsQ
LGLAGVVINRINGNFIEHEFRFKELEEIAADKLLPIRFPERAAVQQAQGAARPIHSWPGEAAAEISQQFDALLGVVRASMQEDVTRRSRTRGKRSSNKAPKQGWFRRNKKSTED